MSDRMKIGWACFVGGMVCVVLALLVAPHYWWLGLVAGIAAGYASGYVSYEFREFCKAVPKALHDGLSVMSNEWQEVWGEARKWMAEDHPFFCLGIIPAVPLGILFNCFCWSSKTSMPVWLEKTASVVFFVEILLVCIGICTVLALLGARKVERCYWWPFIMDASPGQARYQAEVLEDIGLVRKPLTNLNALRWLVKGTGLVVLFLVWTLWKNILKFFMHFTLCLIRAVHKRERVLCGIDGTLGGVLAYIWLAPSCTSPVSCAVLVLFGGLLGAALGVLNYEIISVRLMQWAPGKASA